MTGLIYAVAPLAAACLVARREPAHRPVALALGASALYSVVALPAVASRLDPRALLGLFVLVALASGRAYVRAFGWRWTLPGVTFWIGLVGYSTVLAGAVASRWELLTWGPFVVSSVVGGLAAWAWWERTRAYSEDARRELDKAMSRVAPAFNGPIPHLTRIERASVATLTQRCALVLLASDVCMLLFVAWPGVQAWQGRAAAIAVTVVQIVWLIKERKR